MTRMKASVVLMDIQMLALTVVIIKNWVMLVMKEATSKITAITAAHPWEDVISAF